MKCGKDATLVDRLHARIVIADSGCWEWSGATNSSGYGQLRMDGRLWYTHRAAYEVWVGPIPSGLQIDHLCRNHGCCNPAHLEPVTPRENLLRGVAPSATVARDNVCARGHSLADARNVYVRPDGNGRGCKPCRAMTLREWRRRTRATT